MSDTDTPLSLIPLVGMIVVVGVMIVGTTVVSRFPGIKKHAHAPTLHMVWNRICNERTPEARDLCDRWREEICSDCPGVATREVDYFGRNGTVFRYAHKPCPKTRCSIETCTNDARLSNTRTLSVKKTRWRVIDV